MSSPLRQNRPASDPAQSSIEKHVLLDGLLRRLDPMPAQKISIFFRCPSELALGMQAIADERGLPFRAVYILAFEEWLRTHRTTVVEPRTTKQGVSYELATVVP